jgi:transposase
LVFLDESGFMMAPLVRRSWAPRGVTPVLYQRGRSHQKVSAIAALCVPPGRNRVDCYLRLHPNANVDAAVVVSFLRQLATQLKGAPFVLIWDRLQAHRALAVRTFLATSSAVGSAFLPAYAPELNPVEYVWSYLKLNPLANAALLDLASLTTTTRHHARSLQRQRGLLRSFIHHSPLSLRLRKDLKYAGVNSSPNQFSVRPLDNASP